MSPIVEALITTLSDPERLLGTWRALDLFAEHGSDGLVVRAGRPDPKALARAEAAFEREGHGAFPPALAELLRRVNGFDLEEDESGTAREDGLEFVMNGLLPASELTVDDTSIGAPGLHFATAFGEARVSWIVAGPKRGAVIFEDGKGEAVTLAKSLEAFLAALLERGLSIEATLDQT